MKTLLILASLAIAFGCATAAHAVTFDWAQVGNAGNTGEFSGSIAGGIGPDAFVGAVAYAYAISKTEVTNAQYTEFLNAVDPTGANSLGLYNSEMANNFGGIENTGATDGSRYIAQSGRQQNPVTFVSWYDSVRFINWLHNGQGTGDTETGAYTLLGGTATPSDGRSIARNTDAQYWLPSEDEWYKAAYYDPDKAGGAGYYDYATGSDSIPVSDHPGDDPTAVNYINDDGLANGFNDGYAVSGSTSFPSSTNPFTDVGAYTGAESPYGTFDQNGNVWEWNETLVGSSSRSLRGGFWNAFPVVLAASFRAPGGPASEDNDVGFRIATLAVPEPSSLLLLLSLTSGILLPSRR